jgi:hypothetical protein
MYTGFPRHSTTIRAPTSSLEIFTFTGAPAAFAFALGCQDETNGIAAPTTPAPPTTDVAPNKNLRRLWLTPSLIMTFSLNLKKWNSKHAGSRVSKKGPE